MLLWCIKSIFYSIFLIILLDFCINNTNYLWNKPKIYEYDKSYSKILTFLKTNSTSPTMSKSDDMKLKLENYVNELK